MLAAMGAPEVAPASEIRLRSINDLLGERFFVPSYQRGYRWTAQQVEALLDDLAAFQHSSRQSQDTYYCLQPVVVRRREDAWELVDGQQRLTTIYLIIRALPDVAAILERGRYAIAYETRDGSAALLDQPTREGADEDIDHHHVYQASEAIRRWFKARDGGLRLKLLECLTAPDGTGPNVRVIWYELDKGEDARRAFVRLNVGRIPLTSAELIRALLLRSDRSALDARDTQQIPQDWDLIERRLQDDRYWYFLQSSTSSPPARIEYLFDLFVRSQRRAVEDAYGDDPLATFLAFQRLIEAKDANVWRIWQDFKKLTQTLEDWYEDRTLYHLVGFLVATAPADRTAGGRARQTKLLLDLLEARETATGTEFERTLKRIAWKRFLGKSADELPGDEHGLSERTGERIGSLRYGDQVSTVLLLFNIAGLLEQSADTHRFQFDGYHKNTWDIEHVRSVAEYIPRAAVDRQDWLRHARDFVASAAAAARDKAAAEQLSQDIGALLATSSPDEPRFVDVFDRVRALSGEGDVREDDNALSNLVLLDMRTNRSYKNAIFPVKRMRIIELDTQGQFVPPATRNVFLKYYSPDAAQLMLWDESDQEAYGKALETALVKFFAPTAQKDSEA